MLYDKIKTLAKEKCVSISQIERSCGIYPQSMCKWNEVKPSYDKVVSVAKYLGTTVEELLK